MHQPEFCISGQLREGATRAGCGGATMGFNMFLADDLVSACTQRFKRSKIDAPTYRRACSDTARKTTKLLSLLSPDPLSAPFRNSSRNGSTPRRPPWPAAQQ
jgi:hypothetical protein